MAREGDVESALWHLRRSLELHGQQPAVILMREQLLAAPERWPRRSILERIINGTPYLGAGAGLRDVASGSDWRHSWIDVGSEDATR